MSQFLPSFSHGKIECEPGGVNFTKKRGNGRFAGPQNPLKSYEKAAKSIDLTAFLVETKRIELSTLRMRTVRSPTRAAKRALFLDPKSAQFMLRCEPRSGQTARDSQFIWGFPFELQKRTIVYTATCKRRSNCLSHPLCIKCIFCRLVIPITLSVVSLVNH